MHSLKLPRGGPGRIPLVLAVGSFALAFSQRPGQTFADSRVELTAKPGLFVHQVASLWSSTSDLGHVQSGQFVGYLFPMAPWFALARKIGISMWVAERLWMGALLALAAIGAVLLMDELYGRRRGVAHLVAGVLFAFNPYVATFGSRATVALLAYVAMPWLMVATHRGLRRPHGWVWPACFGLMLAAGGGGVNAAFLPWVIGAPALLAVYEVAMFRRRFGDLWAFGWRTALCSGVASAWWIIPVGLQSSYGGNFLSFLEQPAAIWSTASMSEALRLLGYWIDYFGTGYHGVPEPSVSVAGSYLFNPAVMIATFAVPLLAVLGVFWNRGWRYAPYFLLLSVLGVIAMSAGFPAGKPLERVMHSAYYDIGSLQFLRTTYKAAPDVALGFACLAGAAASTLYASARAGLFRVVRFRVSRWALLPLVLIPVGNALPFFNGTAIDHRLDYKVPSYWRAALADADRETPADQRIMLLPGQLFSWYRWGETVVSIAPVLAQHPLLVRQATLYADPRSSQLLTSVDDLVQQGRLVPGQLPPLLDLMGVGQVLVPADGIGSQSGEPDPATAARALRNTFPAQKAAGTYGQVRPYVPDAGRGGSPVRLPDLRRYHVPESSAGIVRVQPLAGATVLDGDAQGITSLAAVGGLDTTRPLFYAGDLDSASLRDRLRAGATLVFTDSNRRAFVSGSRTTQNVSATVGASDSIPPNLPTYDLFPGEESDEQTVAVYSGLRYLRTPLLQGLGLSPQYRPYAAFDGRLDTTWLPSSPDPSLRYIELGLARPRSIAYIRVHPHADILGGTSRISVSVNGGHEHAYPVNFGWTTLPIRARDVKTLRIRASGVVLGGGLGGLDEVQIPGLRVGESLRLPTRLAQEARSLDLSHTPVSVVLRRTSTDFPYRAGHDVEAPQAGNPFDDVDAEPGLEREVSLPAARSFQVGGWASVNPQAPDPVFDRLTGVPADWRFSSSSRFEGWPIHRASSAFDGNPRTAWVGNYLRQQFAWISVRAPQPFSVRTFRLRPLSSNYAFPTLVEVRGAGGFRRQLPVAPDGTVTLPVTLRTSFLRLNILSLRGSFGPRELRAVAISEIEIPGLAPPHPNRSGPFNSRCGEISVSGPSGTATAAITGDVKQLDAGVPLPLTSCGTAGALSLPAGTSAIHASPGSFARPDLLQLDSAAPAGLPAAAAAGSVLSAGRGDDGSRKGVRVQLKSPGWLVLAESYSRGWRAWCGPAGGKQRSLGAPVPIDGFANGWRVDTSCQDAHFYFSPQSRANAAYVVSAVGAGLMLLLLAAYLALRRFGATAAVPVRGDSGRVGVASNAVRRTGWLAALAIGSVIASVAGFVFAWRAGAVIGVVTSLLLRFGISVRRLLAIATAGLLAIAIGYVASPSPDVGGFYFYYALHYIDEHWMAVGVVSALGAAALLMAWDLRGEPASGAEAEEPGSHRLGTLLRSAAPRLRRRVRGART
jgi:arabinofuranan 3-O-arabinosyltransferase